MKSKENNTIYSVLKTIALSLFIVIFMACSDDDTIADIVEETTAQDSSDDSDITPVDDADFEATDWTTETHSKDADPNFEEVFDNTAVKRFDFVISEERWQSMLDDMTELYGAFGQNSGGPGGQGGGGLIDVDEDPIFV